MFLLRFLAFDVLADLSSALAMATEDTLSQVDVSFVLLLKKKCNYKYNPRQPTTI
jgi:hypothetical protein